MTPFDRVPPSGNASRFFLSGLRTFLILWMVLSQGCSLLQPRSQVSLSDRNAVRFRNAMIQVRSDLKEGRLDDASRLLAIWQDYKGLSGEDQRLLERTAGRFHAAKALYLAGQASQLERLGHFREALDQVREARKLEPGWGSLSQMERHLQIRIAVRSEMGRNWEDLIRRLMVLKVQTPKSLQLDRTLSWAWARLAESQYEKEHYREARKSLLQAVSYDPDNSRARKVGLAISRKLEDWIAEGEQKFRSNDLSGSLLIFRKVLHVDPSSARALRDESLIREALAQESGKAAPSPGASGGSR